MISGQNVSYERELQVPDDSQCPGACSLKKVSIWKQVQGCCWPYDAQFRTFLTSLGGSILVFLVSIMLKMSVHSSREICGNVLTASNPAHLLQHVRQLPSAQRPALSDRIPADRLGFYYQTN